MRRIVFVVLVIALPLILVSPLEAQEQSPIAFSETAVEYTFGQQATFSVDISSTLEITEVYFYLTRPGNDRTEVGAIPFEPGTSVHVSFQRDLHIHPLPPFGWVSIQWMARDAAGNEQMAPLSGFRYVDDRFEWFQISNSDGSVNIYSTVDDPVYMQAALDIAQVSLANIVQELKSEPLSEANVYIYSSLMDLRAAMEMGGREWMGGQARPELGVVLVTIPYDGESISRMEQDIPHELTHLVVYHVTNGTRVPTWLDEGLAMAYQMRPDPNLDAFLEQARAESRLISLTDLCSPFSSNPEIALLSYAQSVSLVRYIQDWYGSTGIRALLREYADGASCEAGIVHALGVSPERLELAWKAHLLGLSNWTTWLTDNAPWLLLWGVLSVVALPMAGAIPRRRS